MRLGMVGLGRMVGNILRRAGDSALIAARQAGRAGHFRPPALMASQCATLHPPAPEEGAILLDLREAPEPLVARALASL